MRRTPPAWAGTAGAVLRMVACVLLVGHARPAGERQGAGERCSTLAVEIAYPLPGLISPVAERGRRGGVERQGERVGQRAGEKARERVGRGRVRGASEPKQAGAHTHTHAQDDLHNNGVRVRLDCLRMGEMFHAYVVLGAHRLYAPVLGNGDEGVLVDFSFEAAALKRQPDG